MFGVTHFTVCAILWWNFYLFNLKIDRNIETYNIKKSSKPTINSYRHKALRDFKMVPIYRHMSIEQVQPSKKSACIKTYINRIENDDDDGEDDGDNHRPPPHNRAECPILFNLALQSLPLLMLILFIRWINKENIYIFKRKTSPPNLKWMKVDTPSRGWTQKND